MLCGKRSVLDVGCGSADHFSQIKRVYSVCHVEGVDIIPNSGVRTIDLLEDDSALGTYDAIVAHDFFVVLSLAEKSVLSKSYQAIWLSAVVL